MCYHDYSNSYYGTCNALTLSGNALSKGSDLIGWTGVLALKLGHGGQEKELVPRLVQALTGRNVIGASAGDEHTGCDTAVTAVWTEEGELFTFGAGWELFKFGNGSGRLGHGGTQSELVPRLVQALALLLGMAVC